jgi:predicted outer membrane repeat protein
MHRALPILVMLVLAWGTAANGADRFVWAKGDDQGGGNSCLNSAAPCRTLSNSLAQAGDGDVIKVAKGLYQENVTIAAAGARAIRGGYDAETFSEATRNIARNKTEFTGSRSGIFLTIDAAGAGIALTLDGVFIDRTVGNPPEFAGGLRGDASAGGSITLTLQQVTMTGNRTSNIGGAIQLNANDGGAVTAHIANSLFRENRAAAGGAMGVRSIGTGTVTVTVEDSTFRNNATSFQGGAIDAFSSATGGGFTAMTFRRTLFDRNTASQRSSGGAIAAFARDRAGDVGGGGAGAVSLTVENSIIQGNTAGLGGAIDLLPLVDGSPAGTATVTANLVNNTLSGNRAEQGGGLSIGPNNFAGAGSSTVTAALQNNIVHGNASDFGGSDIFVDIHDADAHVSLNLKTNDIGSLDVASGATIVADPDPQLSADPQLMKRQGVYHLRATSPVIAAGTCDGAPAVDFDGDPRPTGTGLCGVDIGADQFTP